MEHLFRIGVFGLVIVLIGLVGAAPPPANAASPDDFVITVRTNNIGTSSLTQFTIPTYPGETYNYNVDCNDDGTNEASAQSGDYTCEYGAMGIYTIRIKDNSGAGAGFPRIYFNSSGLVLHNDARKLLSIAQWGTARWTSMNHAFHGCWAMNMTTTDTPDLSDVTDLSYMFANTYSFNGAIDNWNTANVTNMSEMFNGASAFNQPIGSWNTANVTNMSGMFANTDAFNQPIGSWDTAKVTDMSSMFSGARAFNQSLNSWDTANVTDMRYTFNDTWSFNQEISNWNTVNVTDMRGMFRHAGSFNRPIGSWNTANVTDMNELFYHARTFNQDIGSWNTANVTNMSELFAFAGAFNGNIGNWNTANVTDMSYMFTSAASFNQPVGSWNTANVTNMRGMFVYAHLFNQPIGSWNTANVTDMSGMFYDASAFNQDIGGWDTGSVITMSGMFKFASAFNSNIGNWNTANVIEMIDMFEYASAFNQNIGLWNVSKLKIASGMFKGATLSTVNYDALLDGWAAQTRQRRVPFDGGGSHYCNGETARAHLITSTRWDITDGGKLCGSGLRIVKKVTAFRRSTHRYKLRVTNNDAITPYLQVTIKDKLPKGYVITDVSSTGATCLRNGRAVTCARAQLDAGMSIVVKIWATLKGAAVENCATVTSDTTDPNLQDNKACVTVP